MRQKITISAKEAKKLANKLIHTARKATSVERAAVTIGNLDVYVVADEEETKSRNAAEGMRCGNYT